MAAKFDGTDGARITKQKAIDMTTKFRTDKDARELHLGVKAYFLGSNFFEQVLKQDDCVGIRMYHCNKEDGSPTMLIVGVNSENVDMVDGFIADDALLCPMVCGEGSPLI